MYMSMSTLEVIRGSESRNRIIGQNVLCKGNEWIIVDQAFISVDRGSRADSQ